MTVINLSFSLLGEGEHTRLIGAPEQFAGASQVRFFLGLQGDTEVAVEAELRDYRGGAIYQQSRVTGRSGKVTWSPPFPIDTSEHDGDLTVVVTIASAPGPATKSIGARDIIVGVQAG